ncbi:EEF1A lysine methyltransferase 2 [Anopheles maculipalpis]|uniref:EEF1A lysine methyltransferase 2 n=1 Tax=Anopheles maculipalpis TaxID=1496333 RepID=UPI002158CCE7|nr:EEF1A lysine methyltransferase 2 [Anopheles maculipalpis]
MDEEIEELGGSVLGTKHYWEKSYELELKNFHDHGDCGDIWFDEDCQLRIATWIGNRENNIKLDDSIIDLGCGNGMMLIELAQNGFENLTGIDYSPKAIELAKAICKEHKYPNINYKVVDLMSESEVTALGKFKVVHDKGTYDAISIHPTDSKTMRKSYIANVHRLLEDNGLFVLTSCNWTKCELVKSFGGLFELQTVIPSPKFKFGNKEGSVVTSVVFGKASSFAIPTDVGPILQ